MGISCGVPNFLTFQILTGGPGSENSITIYSWLKPINILRHIDRDIRQIKYRDFKMAEKSLKTKFIFV